MTSKTEYIVRDKHGNEMLARPMRRTREAATDMADDFNANLHSHYTDHAPYAVYERTITERKVSP